MNSFHFIHLIQHASHGSHKMKMSDNSAAAPNINVCFDGSFNNIGLTVSYRHQHGHGHGSHTTRYRCNEASLVLGRGIVDITHHPLPAGSAVI